MKPPLNFHELISLCKRIGPVGHQPIKEIWECFLFGPKDFFFFYLCFFPPILFFGPSLSFSLKAKRSRKRENQNTMLLSITHSSILKQKFKIEFKKEILLFAQYNTCKFFLFIYLLLFFDFRLSLLVDKRKNKPSWIRDYLSEIKVYCFL